MLKKLLALALVFAIGVVAMRLLAPKLSAACEQMLGEMPDDFPPKRMFTNLAAIREQVDTVAQQNERIIGLIEQQAPAA